MGLLSAIGTVYIGCKLTYIGCKTVQIVDSSICIYKILKSCGVRVIDIPKDGVMIDGINLMKNLSSSYVTNVETRKGVDNLIIKGSRVLRPLDIIPRNFMKDETTMDRNNKE